MHRIVGLDVAGEELRLVALQSGFRGFSVQEARRLLLPAGATRAERLKQALAQLSPLGDDAVAVAISSAQVASHLVTLPFTDPRRIEQVLPAEVEAAIPFDLAEVSWDHAILSQANGKTDVLVAVVRKATLRDSLAALAEAGIEPRVVTFAPLALAALSERGLIEESTQGRAAEATVSETTPAEPETDAILEAGPDRADLCLLQGKKPLFARGLATASAPAWEVARNDPAALGRLLLPLVRDLKISIRTRKSASLRKLLLAGSICTLPGAAERLSTELGVPVAPLAPAGQAAAAGPLAAETALALGLALRAQHPRGRINFLKGEFAFTKDLSQLRGQIARLSIAASVLLVLALGLGLSRLASLSRQARDYDDALCAATRKVLGSCMTDYRQALAALAGGKSKAAGIPRVSAAEVLAELSANMPEGAMPLLDDVEISTTSLRVRGSADGFAQVDEMIAALKKDKCFGEIKQPHVEKAPGSQKVSFSLEFPYTCSGELPGGA